MNTLARIIALLLLPFARLRLAWERHQTGRAIARLAPAHPELVETDEQRIERLFAEAQAKLAREQLDALAACSADHADAMAKEARESAAMAELKRVMARRGVSELRSAEKAARVFFPRLSDGRVRARVTWKNGTITTYILVGPFWYVDGTGERIDILGSLNELLNTLRTFRETKTPHPMLDTWHGKEGTP